MKKFIVTFCFVSTVLIPLAQNNSLDSLQNDLSNNLPDTSRVFTLLRIGVFHFYSAPDSTLHYAEKALDLARSIKFEKGEAQSLAVIGNVLIKTGNYVKALQTQLKVLELHEKRKDKAGIAAAYNNMALIYQEQGDYKNAITHFYKARDIFAAQKTHYDLLITLLNIGEAYEKMNKLDSGLLYQTNAYRLAIRTNDKENIGIILSNLGFINYKLGNNDLAFNYFKSSIPHVIAANDKQSLADTEYGISLIFEKKGQIDSSILHAKKSLAFSKESLHAKGIQNATTILARLFESKNELDSAYFYLKTAMSVRDTIFNAEIVRKVENMNMNELIRQQEIENAKAQYKNEIRLYVVLILSGVFLFIALFLYRIVRIKQKAKDKMEKAYTELKATQAQLIQREKMASLGELTAGIAHEIQNPLNFVNNFSEVNMELIAELKDGPLLNLIEDEKAEADEILANIAENLQKINHHGKRADSIVKGMLQHSRKSTGLKEATDVNSLADEYLRLSYQGLRAKDKSFNATIETSFDERIGNISIISQDIGRALLNLFNNAFYSVTEKRKKKGEEYKPTVWVSSKKINNRVEIRVKDNGLGISRSLLDKIFEPFFTTKPTGQGTGLGLSLSYDIVKAHGGELKVETEEGEYAEFTVSLPA